jgi:hypothetical protein
MHPRAPPVLAARFVDDRPTRTVDDDANHGVLRHRGSAADAGTDGMSHRHSF